MAGTAGGCRDELSAASFFGDAGAFGGLFAGGEPVWGALDRLKAHIREVSKPNSRGIRLMGGPGQPMMGNTIVLVRGEVLDGGFEVDSWDAAKGGLRVTVGGRLLEGAAVVCAGAVLWDDEIEIGPGSLVEPGAFIRGPAVLGACTEVRQAAYIRGEVLIGSGCVVGHATEVKSSIFLDGAKAGHFAYVGDSILGRDVNLGAGTKLANLKIIPGNVEIPLPDGRVDTGRRKFGAVLGDESETGCNSVTSPGVLLGKRCRVFPNANVAPGFYPGGSVVRNRR